MNERKKGVILSYVQVMLSVLINVIYVPVLLHYLGKGEYGLYQIVGSFFSYVSVFESSMATGVLRNYCNALGRQDEQEAATTLCMATKIYNFMAVFMTLIGVVVIFIFRCFYASSFSIEELNESSAILILLFINMIVTLLGSVYLTIITGNERFIFLKITAILTQLIQPFLVILCVCRWPYAFSVSAIIALLNIFLVILRYLYATRYLKIRIVKVEKNVNIIKEIIGLSLTILFGCIADQIFWKTDQVILGKLFSTSIVAIYSVGAQIYMIYMQFGTQIASVFYPRLSIVYQEKDGNKKISDLFIRIGRISLFIILLILSGFIVFGKEFLYLWVGSGYNEAYYVAIIVMIPFSIDLSQNIALAILQMKNQYGFRAKIYFLSAVLNIILTVILASVMGIVGAAVSTGIAMFITSGLIMNWYYCKKVDLNVKGFWKSVSEIVIAVLIIAVCSLMIKRYIWNGYVSIIELGIGIILFVLVYAVIMYLFVMNRGEKDQIKAILLHRRKNK